MSEAADRHSAASLPKGIPGSASLRSLSMATSRDRSSSRAGMCSSRYASILV